VTILLEAADRALRLEPDTAGGAVLVWTEGDERLVLGKDDRADLCGSLVSSLERALSDEFTVVGSIQGVPVLHLLALERTMIYLSMDRRHLYVQDDENRPIGQLEVDENKLHAWTNALRHG